MSLSIQPIPCIPAATVRIAKAAFPHGNLCLQLRDALGTIYENREFAALFPSNGQPAQSPWQLALVSVLQFAEGLSDRQAADAVRSRIDWKYLLSLELSDPGFDNTVLCEFRARLVAGGAESQLLEKFLKVFGEHQLIRSRGHQRTDSTHVIAAVRTLNRLECVAETMRHALNVLATVAPDWLRLQSQPEWVERYGSRVEEYRLPKGREKRQVYALTIGQDGVNLLEALHHADTPQWLRMIPATQILRQVWLQQYHWNGQTLCWRSEGDGLPNSSQFIASPYDTQAHYSKKRTTAWLGYKVHLSETCVEDAPHLITHVETTLAPVADRESLPSIHQALKANDLLPAVHLADTGYIDANAIIESQAKYEVDLLGPTLSDYHWQAKAAQGFAAKDFTLDWQQKRATCPKGQISDCWTPLLDKNQHAIFKVQFSQAICRQCEAKSQCTRSSRRTLLVQPQHKHEALKRARVREGTEEYRQLYQKRAGIEGTISQGIRAFGLRRSRYVGLAKTHLQHILTAIAINWSRWKDWFDGKSPERTRQSAFVRLVNTS
jgi:transposase